MEYIYSFFPSDHDVVDILLERCHKEWLGWLDVDHLRPDIFSYDHCYHWRPLYWFRSLFGDGIIKSLTVGVIGVISSWPVAHILPCLRWLQKKAKWEYSRFDLVSDNASKALASWFWILLILSLSGFSLKFQKIGSIFSRTSVRLPLNSHLRN